MNKKNIAILGSTGSIGINSLNVVRGLKGKFRVSGLSAYGNLELLKSQIDEFNPKYVCVGSKADVLKVKKCCGSKARIFFGDEGLVRIASLRDIDKVIIAVVGATGLSPLVSAIKTGKNIALAKNEARVMAGGFINSLIKK